MISILTTILVSAALSMGSASVNDNRIEVSPKLQHELEIVEEPAEEIFYADPKCKTPYMSPDEVSRIINETKTMDLNFVALAKGESGLNNISKVYNYRGIFHVHEGYHKLNDYCSPAEQVQWLESKLKAGADPKKLFPALHTKLYE